MMLKNGMEFTDYCKQWAAVLSHEPEKWKNFINTSMDAATNDHTFVAICVSTTMQTRFDN